MLQTYGLYRAVTDLGYECEIIDYRNEAVERREFIKPIYMCRSIRELKGHVLYSGFKKVKARKMSDFRSSEMKTSDVVYTKDTFSELEKRYDSILVGSDLVWDFSINNFDYSYMLDGVGDSIKKIAYASSIGSAWDGSEADKVGKLLSRFDYIGVREKGIQELLSSRYGIPADFVCDPTMLMPSSFWGRMAGSKMIDGNYVLCYMNYNGETMFKDAANYGKKHKLPVYMISYDWVPDYMRPIRPKTIGEFLSLVKNAYAVFTASYHGMLFSLYFNKNFYYYNRGWKERMNSLAEYLDISDREHWVDGKEYKGLDYSLIRSKLEIFRDNSMRLLKSYLA